MADTILVVKTPPGRRPRSGAQFRLGNYQVLYLYRLLPPILDDAQVKVRPTPSAELVEMFGQAWVDRYIGENEIEAFDNGNAAWELVAGQRRTVWDEDTLRVETISEMIARLKTDFATLKARALADWTAEYEFTGKRITP